MVMKPSLQAWPNTFSCLRWWVPAVELFFGTASFDIHPHHIKVSEGGAGRRDHCAPRTQVPCHRTLCDLCPAHGLRLALKLFGAPSVHFAVASCSGCLPLYSASGLSSFTLYTWDGQAPSISFPILYKLGLSIPPAAIPRMPIIVRLRSYVHGHRKFLGPFSRTQGDTEPLSNLKLCRPRRLAWVRDGP